MVIREKNSSSKKFNRKPTIKEVSYQVSDVTVHCEQHGDPQDCSWFGILKSWFTCGSMSLSNTADENIMLVTTVEGESCLGKPSYVKK